MIRSFDLLRRMRAAVTSVLLLSATGSYALNTATIVGSVASPDCLEYRVVGICYWLYCTWTGCTVRTKFSPPSYRGPTGGVMPWILTPGGMAAGCGLLCRASWQPTQVACSPGCR